MRRGSPVLTAAGCALLMLWNDQGPRAQQIFVDPSSKLPQEAVLTDPGGNAVHMVLDGWTPIPGGPSLLSHVTINLPNTTTSELGIAWAQTDQLWLPTSIIIGTGEQKLQFDLELLRIE